MRRRHIGYLAALLLSLVIVMATVWISQASSVTVSVPSLEAKAGSMVDVPIQVVGAPGIGAMQMDLIYDPAVLTPETVTNGKELGSNALLEFNKDTTGRLMMALVTLDAMQGDGTIASARFKVIGEKGQKSALTLENCRVWEGASHQDVVVNTEAGNLSVVGKDKSSFLLWIIIAVIVMILLLVLFIWRKRSAARKQAV